MSRKSPDLGNLPPGVSRLRKAGWKDAGNRRQWIAPIANPTPQKLVTTVSPIPNGYTAVTPYLIVPNTVQLLVFLELAFDACEVRRTPAPTGGALNIEVQIRDAMVMLVQVRPGHPPRVADLYHYVENVDEVYRKAVDAGATSLMAPDDMFYGERQAGVEDPAGNHWWISSRIEDLTTEDLGQRAAQM